MYKLDVLKIMKGGLLWIVIFGIVLYAGLILWSDVSKISEQFLQIKIEYVVLVFAIGLLSHTIRIIRQKELLQIVKEKISLKKNFIVYLAGLVLVFTPGGIGLFIKAHFLKQKFNIENHKSLPVIFMERLHDLLAVTTIIFVGLTIYFSWLSASLVIISSILFFGVYFLICNQKFFSMVEKRLSKVKLISEKLSEISPNGSFFLLTRPKPMAKNWLISIAGWGLDALAVYLGFLAFNVDLGYILTSQIYFTSIGYGILSLVPGGLGVTEGVAEYLLVKNGLAISLSSSLVIFTRLVTIWFSTSIGVLFTRLILKQKIDFS